MRGKIIVVPCVAMFNEERKALMLKRSGGKGRSGKWELPGGSLRFGETPRDAACREFLEETGFRIDPKRLESVDTFGFIYEDRRGGVEFIIPLYSHKASMEPVLRPDEHEDWCWMSIDEIKELEEQGDTLLGVYEMVSRALLKTEELGDWQQRPGPGNSGDLAELVGGRGTCTLSLH